MTIGSYIQKAIPTKPELSRKFIHVSAASWIVFWSLFDETHWSWRLNVLVPVAMFFKLFYLGAIKKDPNDPETASMIRTSNPTELLYGPIHFTMLMTYVGLHHYSSTTPHKGIIIMSSMIGDGIAPLIGQAYGRYTYRVPMGNRKTVEGSAGVLIGTILGCLVFSCALGVEEWLEWRKLVAFGSLAAFVEGCSPGRFDNLVLTLVLDLSFDGIMNIYDWRG